jgi:hypothetical protein
MTGTFVDVLRYFLVTKECWDEERWSDAPRAFSVAASRKRLGTDSARVLNVGCNANDHHMKDSIV